MQRRRGSALESAILDAGWDQLIEAGYDGFTIEAVATRSGSARSVLYRRWPSRLDLLKAVIRHRGEIDRIPVPDTGTLRDDVVAVLTEFNDRRSRIIGIIAARLGAYFDEPDGSPKQLRDLFLSDGPTAMETIVERAVQRGELAAVPPARIVSLPADLVRHELLMTMTAVPADTIREIVDDIFLPLATRSGQER
ncbi:TetR/AcrR family transcriptional regulator [Mycolicibacterium smegmatis]|uniref:TetR-family transcriptional regulator n=2 Tax=Mycolicibacterium smegmatis (strain ATCC 700084 / mc(2)155) TaxID=246196 RepID=I7G1N0_MYCS2|nr:TetR/AcrR family transcriptional regulator [Mycolicibacterium smegmatis]ABK70399.1 repressor protein [Mycolicibacterium smegmatis MC2 155]AFP39697.1 TetR-family transcriptional regulator [Mycolicibacterium smegmatis MC2 155]AIU08464.1 TetR family transcriptional regulator [Mycolicibacterium smegmatis MC2 155]AIU15089.1 TetR family transcriptional regulator [Mycolicibacterium smegmatis]AIU21712.1 TetR family transcriptional regulator [Mycolicibacterium smegmatis]